MDVFDLVAKLSLDKSEYEKGLDKAKGIASKVGGGIKDGIENMAKAGAVALGAGVTAIGALGKQAIESIADYEQLAGGVETLFKDSALTVINYADMAYETAGLSANEYMETVTSFSASLIQSLGGDTAKASELADMAIIDMSDNANKMGSDMSTIQSAYQGFAKQNYTMLDNLKLGYGGTATEMARLMDDASKLNKEFADTANYSIDSKGHLEANYADIVRAIHIVQENMDITGTTAKEAGETISGSLNMVKAQWQNVITSVAGGDWDIGVYVSNLVEAVKTFGKNILPVINDTLSGIGELVEGLAPLITELIPVIFDEVLPPLLDGAVSLIETLGKTLMDNLDIILDAGLELIMTLLNGIVENIPKLMDGIGKVVTKIRDFLIDDGNLTKIVEGATRIIVELATGLIKAIPKLIKDLPKIIKAIFDGIVAGTEDIRKAGGQLIDGLWNGIKEKWEGLKQKVKDLANGLVSSVKDIFGIHSPSRVFAEIGQQLVNGLNEGSEDMFSANGLHANVSAKVTGGIDTADINNNSFKIDYDKLGQSVANALTGFSINMDGRSVAQLIANDMNYQLGVLNARRV